MTVDGGSATPPTADVPMRVLSLRVTERLAERVQRAATLRGWDTSTYIRSLLAGATATVDHDHTVTCSAPLRELEIGGALDRSGVAGEPEATTKEASEIASAVPPTPTHVDTVSGPAAADLAGGVVVSDAAVAKAFVAASTAYSRWTTRPNRDAYVFDAMREAASGAVAAAAPLVVEHYLRTRIRDHEVVSTPEEVWDRVREMARSAALRTVVVDALRAAADGPDINSCTGVCAEVLHERADELERGTDG
jgi:hypothetical protein